MPGISAARAPGTSLAEPCAGKFKVPDRRVPDAAPSTDSAGRGVPYITRWSGEQNARMPVVMRRDGRRIGYADERAYDRDERGVLWSRTPSQPGRGKPEWGMVHSLRQRVSMTQLRCQICGHPADRNADGTLWLLDARPDELVAGDETTTHPPVCRPCAQRSVRACPHLRSAFTTVRVRAFTPWGVNGVLYAPDRKQPVPVEAGTYSFADMSLPWVRAHQLVVNLTDFTPQDLGELRR